MISCARAILWRLWRFVVLCGVACGVWRGVCDAPTNLFWSSRPRSSPYLRRARRRARTSAMSSIALDLTLDFALSKCTDGSSFADASELSAASTVNGAVATGSALARRFLRRSCVCSFERGLRSLLAGLQPSAQIGPPIGFSVSVAAGVATQPHHANTATTHNANPSHTQPKGARKQLTYSFGLQRGMCGAPRDRAENDNRANHKKKVAGRFLEGSTRV